MRPSCLGLVLQAFLVDFLDATLSCRFTNFLGNRYARLPWCICLCCMLPTVLWRAPSGHVLLHGVKASHAIPLWLKHRLCGCQSRLWLKHSLCGCHSRLWLKYSPLWGSVEAVLHVQYASAPHNRASFVLLLWPAPASLVHSERDRQLMRERLCACRRGAPAGVGERAGPGCTVSTGEPLLASSWEPQGPSPGATDAGCIWAYLRRKRGPCPWMGSSRGARPHRQGWSPRHASGAPHPEPQSPEEEGGVGLVGSLRGSDRAGAEPQGGYSHEHWNPLYSPPPLSSGVAAPGAPEGSHPHMDQQQPEQQSQSVLLQLLPSGAPLSPVLIPELHFRWTHSATACSSLGLGRGSGVPRAVQAEGGYGGGWLAPPPRAAVARLELCWHPMLAELRWLHRELAASRQVSPVPFQKARVL